MTATAMSAVPQIAMVSWRSPSTGPELLELAEWSGVSGVQLDFGGPGREPWLDAPGNVAAMRERADKTGVELLAVAGNTLNDIGLHAPWDSRIGGDVRELVTRMIDTAVQLGCGLVFLPSFRRSAIDDAEALRRTARVLSWAAGEAAGAGLLLANENTLDRQDAAALVDAVAAPNFRLVLDTYNLPAAGVDPVEIITGLSGHVADQVHLKDGAAHAGPALLGQGDGGVDATVEALAQAPIAVRFLVLENDYRDGDGCRMRADIAWARERSRRLWHTTTGELHE